MPKNNETTTKFKVDISELKAGIQEANRQIRLANAEFKAASSGMDNWSKSTDGVSAKIKQLETVLSSENKKLESLKKQLELVEKEQGESSKGADELRIAIANQQASVNKTEKSLKDYQSTLDSLENGLDDVADASKDADEETEDLADGFTVLKGAAADLLADGLKNIASSIVGLADDTREYRTEMGKLETSFVQNGHTVEAAKKTYREFYGVLGDEGQATEAVNFLAKMTDNEKDLATWTDICTGVYAEFGNSLPIEGLTEAANETAKTGTVTGGLADALNWAGLSEDEFNEKLAACSSEQERQKLIMDTLNGVYSDSADKFREVNGEVIEANKAQSDLNDTTAELGATVEPLKTKFTELKTKALQWLIDTGLPGIKSGFGWVADNIPAVVGIIGTLTAAWLTFGGAQKIVDMYNKLLTVSQTTLNTAMKANPIGLIVTAISLLVTAFITLWTNCEGFRNFFIKMWDGIKKAFSAFMDFIEPGIEFVKELFQGLWDAIKIVWDAIVATVTPVVDAIVGAFQSAWEAIKVIWDLVAPYFTAIWEGIKAVFSVVADVLGGFFSAAWDAIKVVWDVAVEYFTTIWNNIKSVFSVVKTFFEGMFKTAWESIKAVWDTVVSYFTAIWDTIKGIFSVVKDVLTGNWSDAWEGIKGIVDTWADFFSGIWENIKGVFSSVGSWFSDTFSAAWEAVKNVFSGWGDFFSGLWDKIKNTFSSLGTSISNAIGGAVTTGINGVISGIESIINAGVRLINGAIDAADSIIPGDAFGNISEVSLPRLARGGVLEKGQVGLLEGSGAEAVVPLENNEKWIRKTAQDLKKQLQMQGLIGGSNNPTTVNNNYNFTQNNTSPKALSRLEIYRMTKNQLLMAKGV